MQLPNLFRKFGESEDPLFRDVPEFDNPPPDVGDVGSASTESKTLRKLDIKDDLNG